jgi:fibrillarin-like rRNA methylase
MAHFAKLNSANLVEKVVVVSNDVATNEQAGIDHLNHFMVLIQIGNNVHITHHIICID